VWTCSHSPPPALPARAQESRRRWRHVRRRVLLALGVMMLATLLVMTTLLLRARTGQQFTGGCRRGERHAGDRQPAASLSVDHRHQRL
jgi:hypothetical protein